MRMKNIKIAYGFMGIGAAETGEWDVHAHKLTIDKTKWTPKILPELASLKGKKMNVKAEPLLIGTRGAAASSVETAPDFSHGLTLESSAGQNGKAVLKA